MSSQQLQYISSSVTLTPRENIADQKLQPQERQSPTSRKDSNKLEDPKGRLRAAGLEEG